MPIEKSWTPLSTLHNLSVIIPWSPYSSLRRVKILNWILSRYECQMPEVEVVMGKHCADGAFFNRSLARNNGVNRSSRDILLIADGDTIPERETIEMAIDKLTEAPWVIPYADDQYYNINIESSDKILAGNPCVSIGSFGWDHKLMSWAGLLLIKTDDFHKIGGYDERFVGWGWEDLAFRVTADNVLGKYHRSPGRALHLWHERDDALFGTSEELANRTLFDKEYRRKYNWIDERIKR